MVNTRTKGNKVQREAIKRLELAGYLVSKVELSGKFTKQKDLFGLFDLIGIKKGEAVFVQATTNRPHLHKPYKDFSLKYSNNGISYWQWVWYDRKGWVKHQYRFGNKVTYDERKTTKKD